MKFFDGEGCIPIVINFTFDVDFINCKYKYNAKHKTEVKYIIYLSNRKQKSYCFSKLNENSMPFGRKIQLKKDLREAA